MSATVYEVTGEELKQLVEEKLSTLFHDPEDDLEITDELKELLARQNERMKNGERGETLEDIVARLGLN